MGRRANYVGAAVIIVLAGTLVYLGATSRTEDYVVSEQYDLSFESAVNHLVITNSVVAPILTPEVDAYLGRGSGGKTDGVRREWQLPDMVAARWGGTEILLPSDGGPDSSSEIFDSVEGSLGDGPSRFGVGDPVATANSGIDPFTLAEFDASLRLVERNFFEASAKEFVTQSSQDDRRLLMRDAEQALFEMKSQVGENAYDRYLFSLGRANRVVVSGPLPENVAPGGGLFPGDLLVRYNGRRVFDIHDLRGFDVNSAFDGEFSLEVEREGKKLVLNLPAGIDTSSFSTQISRPIEY